jgi:ABC-type sugar transport system permease subunit
MGSATLIYLAALQSIPGELYEAAELDGAGVLQRLVGKEAADSGKLTRGGS